jgi:hypothetical protein
MAAVVKKKKEKDDLISKFKEYKKQRGKYSDAMSDKGRHDRLPYNLSEKDLMKLLSYADEDKVFGSKVKAGEIRQFLNDRAKDKVLSRPEFKKAVQNKKDGGMMNKKLTKTVPPKKRPNSQGMRGTGIAIRGTKFKGVF